MLTYNDDIPLDPVCGRCFDRGTIQVPKYAHMAKLRSNKRFAGGKVDAPCPNCAEASARHAVYFQDRSGKWQHVTLMASSATDALERAGKALSGHLGRYGRSFTKTAVARLVDK